MSVALGIAGLPQHVLDYVDATYAHAYAAGLEEGRRQAEASMQASWAPVVAHVRSLGGATNQKAAELATARGQHHRAEAIRQNLAARGVAA